MSVGTPTMEYTRTPTQVMKFCNFMLLLIINNHKVVDDWSRALDQGFEVCIVFFDISKAFREYCPPSSFASTNGETWPESIPPEMDKKLPD